MYQQPFGKGDPPAEEGDDSSGGSNSSTSDDASDHASDSDHKPLSDDGGGEVHSGDEALDMFEDPSAGADEPIPPIDDHMDDAPLVPAVPLPDPIELGIPAWAPGVEKAEVNNSAKTKCMYCKEAIARSEIRFKLWHQKSAFKLLHPTCFDQVPANMREHSVACLRYQLAFLTDGPDAVKIDEAITAALA